MTRPKFRRKATVAEQIGSDLSYAGLALAGRFPAARRLWKRIASKRFRKMARLDPENAPTTRRWAGWFW